MDKIKEMEFCARKYLNVIHCEGGNCTHTFTRECETCGIYWHNKLRDADEKQITASQTRKCCTCHLLHCCPAVSRETS